jgi:hypothetical protein
MLSSSMLLLNLIPLIDVTFSTPTPVAVEKLSAWADLVRDWGSVTEFFLLLF